MDKVDAATETIVALSSPPLCGSGGALQRAIIRLSGPRAIELADSVFKVEVSEKARGASRLREAPQPAVVASLVDAGGRKRWRRVAGSVTWRAAHENELAAHACVMPAPHSYTREDMAELHVPALPWLVEQLLDTLLARGARGAAPGEFTRRAFEHGRISLEQAETVGRLIASASAAEARAHAQQLATHLDTDREKLKAGLEELLSQVELGLDFAHEDVVVISADEMQTRIDALLTAARKLAEDSTRDAERAPASVHPRVVLVGPTNAGKSMLFNALAGRDAAIVSTQRHTTRDAVEAALTLGKGAEKFTVTLIDSAGAGESSAALFQAAWEATRRALRGADVVLVALDGSVPLGAQEGLAALGAELSALKDVEQILVRTKADLPRAGDDSAAGTAWGSGTRDAGLRTTQFRKEIFVSALTGEGVEGLRDYLTGVGAELSRRSAEAATAAGAARRACARSIAESLERAALALREKHGEDALAVELREAIHACWQAEGVLMRHDAVTEAALDKIFARFCIGK